MRYTCYIQKQTYFMSFNSKSNNDQQNWSERFHHDHARYRFFVTVYVLMICVYVLMICSGFHVSIFHVFVILLVRVTWRQINACIYFAYIFS